MRAVVIDDDADLVSVMHDALLLEGIDVVGCTDGDAAFGCVLAVLPDLVILDVQMGRQMTGLGILERMRAHPETADTPVIVCTAVELERGAIQLPTYRVETLSKPFDIDNLLALIRALTSTGQPEGHASAS